MDGIQSRIFSFFWEPESKGEQPVMKIFIFLKNSVFRNSKIYFVRHVIPFAFRTPFPRDVTYFGTNLIFYTYTPTLYGAHQVIM